MDYSNLHLANIIGHVICGSLALIIGYILLIKSKGTLFHKKLGRYFVYLMVIVVITGIFGVIIFKRNMFLLVITILVGYNTYSGVRNIKTKINQFYFQDLLAMLLAIGIVSYFWYYLQTIGFYWNPVIIYSTVGYLFIVISYDIFRYFIPKNRYANLWIYEHSCKMISALGGLTDAFIGTILPDYKPYSQILPSVITTFIMIYFVIDIYRKNKIYR